MCTVLLPPGGYPIAVKYISYHIIYQLLEKIKEDKMGGGVVFGATAPPPCARASSFTRFLDHTQ